MKSAVIRDKMTRETSSPPRVTHSPQTTSSRILLDIPCEVCRDHSSGKHYGIFACDGCAGFFKRSVRRDRQYSCKGSRPPCPVDKARRNQCRACRLAKCLQAGMNKDAVQHERGPRNSTLRRQLALMLKDPGVSSGPSSTSPINNSSMPMMQPHITQATAEEATREAAARLLFMNVRWARQVSAFSALPMADRVSLLQETWAELFVLGAAHTLPPPSGSSPAEMSLRSALVAVARSSLDPHEMAWLRAIVLFRPGVPNLADDRAVLALRDHANLVLEKYVTMAYPNKPLRFGSLLMLLPTLKMVSASAIEELYFRKTIGNIPIERIISDMYRNTENEP